MALYNEIRARDIPLVFFNAKYSWSAHTLVAMDDYAAGQMATEHLISLGHRKITGIFAFDNMQGHKRYQGFMNSLMKHNILIPESRIMWFPAAEQSALFAKSGSELSSLLDDSTAVVCYNDSLAVELLGFCKQQGRNVPDDLSVVALMTQIWREYVKFPLHLSSIRRSSLVKLQRRSCLSRCQIHHLNQKDTLFLPKLIKRASSAPIGLQNYELSEVIE